MGLRLGLLVLVWLGAATGAGSRPSDEPSLERLLDDAVAAHEAGRPGQALELYSRALASAEATDATRLFCSLNASVLACDLGRYDEARALALGAASLAEAAKDLEALAKSRNNLGLALQRLGDLDAALAEYEAALEIKLERGDVEGVATNHGNRGVVLFELGRYSESLAAQETSEAIARERADRKSVV